MLAHGLRRWPTIETASGECSVFAVSILVHRLRRWPNIETGLGELKCPVFTGNADIFFNSYLSRPGNVCGIRALTLSL